jgi:hypothetical protein
MAVEAIRGRLLRLLVHERKRRGVEAALDGVGALRESNAVVHQALPRERAHFGRRVGGRGEDRALEHSRNHGEQVQRPVLQRVQQAHAAGMAHRLLLGLEKLRGE